MANKIRILLFIVGLFYGFGAFATPSPQKILSDAFEKTQCLTFSCEFRDKATLSEFGADKGMYHQLHEDGFTYKKLELFDKTGSLLACFLKNEKGSFAWLHGRGGKIAEIPALNFIDSMTADISEPEKKICTYSLSTKRIGSDNFWEVRINSTADASRIASANKEMFLFYEGSDKIYSPVYAKRPMQRIFYVSRQNGIVFLRQHFTHRKQLVYEKGISAPDFTVNLNPKDFESDWKIDGDYVLMMDEFAAPLLDKFYKQRLNLTRDNTYYSNSLFIQFIDWALLPKNACTISIAMLLLAVVFIIIAVIVKRKNSN